MLRKARHPVEGEQPITPMTVCYLLMSIIIILLIIIYIRITNFVKNCNTELHEMHLYARDINAYISDIKEYVNHIYSVSDKSKDILEFHVKDTLNHLMFDTDGIIEELKYVAKCCKENEAKFSYIITTIKHLAPNKTKKATKPKTAKPTETAKVTEAK